MTRHTLWQLPAISFLVLAAFIALPVAAPAAAQDAVLAAYSCDTAATPNMHHGGTATSDTHHDGNATPNVHHDGMDMGTPATAAEFDQFYIDMMIPHHASIVALSQAALPRLQDDRLVAIAKTIVAAQTTEIDELRDYREQWYGSSEPIPMDEHAMMQLMPDMVMSMDDMMVQMDADTQVALFCAADDPDRVFIDLVIPHHLSAIAVSEAALDQATHDEIGAFAERVINDQQREISELSIIRQERYGSVSPEAVVG